MTNQLRGTCQGCGTRQRVSKYGYVYDHMRHGLWCSGGWDWPTESAQAFKEMEARHHAEQAAIAKELHGNSH